MITILDIHEKVALSSSDLYMIECDLQDDTGTIYKNTTQIVTEEQLQEYFRRKGKK